MKNLTLIDRKQIYFFPFTLAVFCNKVILNTHSKEYRRF
jgi:hypothetical protein